MKTRRALPMMGLARLDRPAGILYGLGLPQRLPRAQVAQLVEHATENRSVGGSIPPLGTIQIIGKKAENAIVVRRGDFSPRTFCGPKLLRRCGQGKAG